MSGRLFITVLVQTLILLAMIGMRQWTLATGIPVILETQPIDPRSLFSGDYVRLNYKVSDLKLEELAGDGIFKRHDTVFVVLAPDGEYWKAVSVHRSRPRPGDGQAVIKGSVEYTDDKLWDAAGYKMAEVTRLHVKYGIEDYFVQEGTGRELERPQQDEKVSIQVAVDRFGNAGIKAVLVNGRPKTIETLL
ncbi:MAG: GDYXXLXY domain-containing protein [Betaproteobacteria bacterium]|nr:GDYXXLXY domain-containing protein [Betaproteobacteria bacterium]